MLLKYIFHGLSGADIVVSMHGIGNTTVDKVDKNGGLTLSEIGDVQVEIKSVEAQVTVFISAAYCDVAESRNSVT